MGLALRPSAIASFLTKTVQKASKNNDWITKGIKTSRKRKRNYYRNYQFSRNEVLEIHSGNIARRLLKLIILP